MPVRAPVPLDTLPPLRHRWPGADQEERVRPLILSVAAVAALATAACSSPPPDPEPSPTATAESAPSPSPTPSPAPTFAAGTVTAEQATPSAIGGDLSGAAGPAAARRAGKAATALVLDALTSQEGLPWADTVRTRPARRLLRAVPDGASVDAAVTATPGGMYVTVTAGPITITLVTVDGRAFEAVAIQEA